ncbi:hypothetical protein QFZ36_000390 [Pseudarthrobacter siccitolerans]|uniref:Uncharacterized protein n=1 Tax=Pseudarthrobacter siccitolerans TaxID=861266 RepID=A0ABU0PHR2_9MICC|nr:hypothetical protein [Pseudarthrobacter siccitolerans]
MNSPPGAVRQRRCLVEFQNNGPGVRSFGGLRGFQGAVTGFTDGSAQFVVTGCHGSASHFSCRIVGDCNIPAAAKFPSHPTGWADSSGYFLLMRLYLWRRRCPESGRGLHRECVKTSQVGGYHTHTQPKTEMPACLTEQGHRVSRANTARRCNQRWQAANPLTPFSQTVYLGAAKAEGLPPLLQRPSVGGAITAVAILAAAPTSLVEASVVGMFNVPFVADIQFAQQSLDHANSDLNRSAPGPQGWPSSQGRGYLRPISAQESRTVLPLRPP